MSPPRAVVAVDLGKSRCRVIVSERHALAAGLTDVRSGRRPVSDGPGAPGLAAAGGVAAALEAILPLTAHLDVPISALSVGAAGAWAAPAAASELARSLAGEMGVSAVVTSDVVSAHAGALAGGPGVLLIAGTGAAALGIGCDGARLIDGWGPELGDFGSGSWFGREALRAVLRASVGLGPDTALSDAVSAPIGGSSSIHAWLAQDDQLPRRLASLAPLVLDGAEMGDLVATEIAAEGIRLLVASAVGSSATSSATSPRSSAVALHGGLTEHVWFRAALETALHDAGCALVISAGDALDGSLLLAERADLPHERFVHRAE